MKVKKSPIDINICFKYRDKMDANAIPPITEREVEMMKEALDLFNEYVMGGIELLYESFSSSAKWIIAYRM